MREVVIASAARTAIGSYGGGFAGVSAVDLGSAAAKEATKRAGIGPVDFDDVLIGNVLSAGLGQNVARQIGMAAGLPASIPGMTLNMVCGSGLRAVILATQIISIGDADIILAGGTENMTMSPYLLEKHRWGSRMGDDTLTDAMIRDGLWDVYGDYHMGITAENIAEKWNISREEQDRFATLSQQRAEQAIKAGKFTEEITPVSVPVKKGKTVVIDRDEFPRPGTTVEKLSLLRPAFKTGGTVTAGNSSGINDGAAVLVIMSRRKADELAIKPMAVIRSYSYTALDPEIMGYGPVSATEKALKKAGMSVSDLDLVEANEAFAAQSIAVIRDLQLDPEIVNVNGGAIALGHPIGASGARILATLLYEMKRRGSKTGLATLCVGGGMAASVIVEGV